MPLSVPNWQVDVEFKVGSASESLLDRTISTSGGGEVPYTQGDPLENILRKFQMDRVAEVSAVYVLTCPGRWQGA
jgi:hypothetical protein